MARLISRYGASSHAIGPWLLRGEPVQARLGAAGPGVASAVPDAHQKRRSMTGSGKGLPSSRQHSITQVSDVFRADHPVIPKLRAAISF